MTTHFNRRSTRESRRELRNNPTAAEQKLWQRLRRSQLGARFHRQFSIAHYILDFYAPRARLCIEVDGDSHFTPEGMGRDARRSAYLEELGIRILRFTNVEVCNHEDAVVEAISIELHTRISTSP